MLYQEPADKKIEAFDVDRVLEEFDLAAGITVLGKCEEDVIIDTPFCNIVTYFMISYEHTCLSGPPA